MIAQGLSDAEIDRRCGRSGELPGWLSGTWLVTEHLEGSNVAGFGYAPTTVVWRIEVGAGAGGLAIATVVDHHLADAGMARTTPVEVRDMQTSGGRLSFATRRPGVGTIVTTRYELDLSGEQDVVTGRWRSRDTGSFGLPPLEMWGAVQMVKD